MAGKLRYRRETKESRPEGHPPDDAAFHLTSLVMALLPLLPLSPLVVGAVIVGLLVITPFCVLMWRAGYNVG